MGSDQKAPPPAATATIHSPDEGGSTIPADGDSGSSEQFFPSLTPNEQRMLEWAEERLDQLHSHTTTKHFQVHGWQTTCWWLLLVAYEVFVELDCEPQWEVTA